MKKAVELKRTITLPMLTLYGLGTIIGAGIFVLVGKVAGLAGMFAPVAFVLASIIAGFTAFSYAELSSRFPKCAGEAVYLQEVFHLRTLSTIVGLAIVITGIASAATIVNGSVGYLQMFIALPDWLIIILLILPLSLLAVWGISESVGVAAFTTSIAIAGLVALMIFNADHLVTLPERLPELLPPADTAIWGTIVFGAFIAFYAFIGFEDMINIAEEVKDPRRNMPRAIVLALVITTLLYTLLALTAVLALPVDELAASQAPLAALIGEDHQTLKLIIAAVSVIAIADGALIQIIKSARILYGMSRQQMLPELFSRIHPGRQTPVVATVFVAVSILLIALSFPLLILAQITSFITLIVFGAINLALWVLKRRPETIHAEGINVPAWVPATGFTLCLLFIFTQLLQL